MYETAFLLTGCVAHACWRVRFLRHVWARPIRFSASQDAVCICNALLFSPQKWWYDGQSSTTRPTGQGAYCLDNPGGFRGPVKWAVCKWVVASLRAVSLRIL